MSDDVKPQPERPDVGRVGVCSIGYLGVIAGIGDMPWGEAWVGTGVVTGAPWSSRTPVVLSKQDEAWVLTLAERLRAAEALAARWMTAALRSASTLGVAFDPNNPEAWMSAQTAHVLREIERRKTAEAELAAAWAALEEMRWPDLPGVPFYVKTPDGIGKREIPASEVVGIFDALRTHARALLPFGVAAVESHYAIEAIKAENARLREALALLAAVEARDSGIAVSDTLTTFADGIARIRTIAQGALAARERELAEVPRDRDGLLALERVSKKANDDLGNLVRELSQRLDALRADLAVAEAKNARLCEVLQYTHDLLDGMGDSLREDGYTELPKLTDCLVARARNVLTRALEANDGTR